MSLSCPIFELQRNNYFTLRPFPSFPLFRAKFSPIRCALPLSSQTSLWPCSWRSPCRQRWETWRSRGAGWGCQSPWRRPQGCYSSRRARPGGSSGRCSGSLRTSRGSPGSRRAWCRAPSKNMREQCCETHQLFSCLLRHKTWLWTISTCRVHTASILSAIRIIFFLAPVIINNIGSVDDDSRYRGAHLW